jgi:hypothetical protein
MTAPGAEDRDWTRVREAAIDAVAAVTGDPQAAPAIADAVLAVCDEEAVSQMAGQMVEATRIKSLDFRNGMKMDLVPARELAALWAGAARGMLLDAANYVEMEIGLAGDPERFVFRLERCGHLTPHQARIQAEERAAEAQAETARLRAQLERLTQGGTGPDSLPQAHAGQPGEARGRS